MLFYSSYLNIKSNLNIYMKKKNPTQCSLVFGQTKYFFIKNLTGQEVDKQLY